MKVTVTTLNGETHVFTGSYRIFVPGRYFCYVYEEDKRDAQTQFSWEDIKEIKIEPTPA